MVLAAIWFQEFVQHDQRWLHTFCKLWLWCSSKSLQNVVCGNGRLYIYMHSVPNKYGLYFINTFQKWTALRWFAGIYMCYTATYIRLLWLFLCEIVDKYLAVFIYLLPLCWVATNLCEKTNIIIDWGVANWISCYSHKKL